MDEQEKTGASRYKGTARLRTIYGIAELETADSRTDRANVPTNRSADGTDDGSDGPTDKLPKSAKQRFGTSNDTKFACGSSNEFTSYAWIRGI